jgi:hypothetical protein
MVWLLWCTSAHNTGAKAHLSLGFEVAVFLTVTQITAATYPLGTLRPIYRTGVKLLSRCPILYIYSTNIRTEYFKHAV